MSSSHVWTNKWAISRPPSLTSARRCAASSRSTHPGPRMRARRCASSVPSPDSAPPTPPTLPDRQSSPPATPPLILILARPRVVVLAATVLIPVRPGLFSAPRPFPDQDYPRHLCREANDRQPPHPKRYD